MATLKIRRTIAQDVVFTVSGQLAVDNVSELRQMIHAEGDPGIVVLDLADLVLASREAVRFLRECEAGGRIVLRNCPAYIRIWMANEDTQ